MGHTTITGMINGIAQPVFTRVADDKARQLAVFRKLLRFTAFISFPAMLGLSLVSKELIIITITEKWLPSADIDNDENTQHPLQPVWVYGTSDRLVEAIEQTRRE